jgi:hypothetical protein
MSTIFSLNPVYQFKNIAGHGTEGFDLFTALAPRLDNGGWLGLTVPASHRLYSQRRTGAPPLSKFLSSSV